MNKLKVIQLLPELNVGGVERGTCDFSNALVKNGHKSVVISNGGIYEKDIINHGGKHINLPIHKKSLFSLLLSKKLKNIYEEEKPDVVHIRSRMPAWINYYAFKKLSDKPLLISTFHGLYSTPIYSQVMSKVDDLLDRSIIGYDLPETDGNEYYDLSQIDFTALKEKFESGKKKRTKKK